MKTISTISLDSTSYLRPYLYLALIFYLIPTFPMPAMAGGTAISPSRLNSLFNSISPYDLASSPVIQKRIHNREYSLFTFIDVELQSYLMRKVEGNISPMVMICCIDPVSGRVLAVAESDKTGGRKRLITQLLAPSASLFKIVTAAAAMESCGFRPKATFCFNGKKHTLYKKQLNDDKNRWTQTVSLDEAFAQSINPIFGKIGINCLKKDGLLKAARQFGWGMEIPFELPVAKSIIKISDQEYNWAEIASGFNKDTRITALHAALIAAAIANEGVMMRPLFIDSVRDHDNMMVYQSAFGPILKPVDRDTALAMRLMMRKTVTSGTAKKSFRGWKRDKVLKELEIGGKTGTINSRDNRFRYDWFCGYAWRPSDDRMLAVGALIVHADPLGFKASLLAKMAFRKYFQEE